MTITLDIDANTFASGLEAIFARVKVPCQAAMANAFAGVVDSNFGSAGNEGQDRPIEWENLRSKKYAKRVGRTHATLELEGELRSSVYVLPDGEDAAIVETLHSYAGTHQFGDTSRNIAERPFFPIMGNEVTEFTTQKCLESCAAELERSLK